MENLDAVLATEGFKHLVASRPMVLTERGTMKHTYTQLTEGVQSVYLLKIDGFSITKDTIGKNTNCIKSMCDMVQLRDPFLSCIPPPAGCIGSSYRACLPRQSMLTGCTGQSERPPS